eukprot:264476_1
MTECFANYLMFHGMYADALKYTHSNQILEFQLYCLSDNKQKAESLLKKFQFYHSSKQTYYYYFYQGLYNTIFAENYETALKWFEKVTTIKDYEEMRLDS